MNGLLRIGKEKSNFYTILFVIFSILLSWNIFTPLTEDVLVSFASSFQAKFLGEFPQNVYHSWNLRGFGYKYIFYFISSIKSLFISIPQEKMFLYKVIYYSLYFFFLYIFYRIFLLSRILNKKQSKFFFYIISISVLSCSHWISMQAEEIALLFAIGYFSLIFSNNKILRNLSGIFILLISSLKFITVLYLFFPAVLIFFYADRKQIVLFFISNLIFLIFTIFFYFYIIPFEIVDLKNAVFFQNSFFLNKYTPLHLATNFIKSFSHIISLNLFIILSIYSLNKLPKKNILILFIFVIISSLFVVSQSKYFSYHYEIFLIPYFLIIYYIIQYKIINKLVFKVSLCTSLFYLLSMVISKDIFFKTDENPAHNIYFKHGYSSVENYSQNSFKIIFKASEWLKNNIQSSHSKPILFLTDGIINFYLPRFKSYSRYFYPLPLQRTLNNSNSRNSPIYKTALDEVAKYRGEYIVIQYNWFDLNLNSSLKKLILNNYKLVNSFDSHQNSNYSYRLYIKK